MPVRRCWSTKRAFAAALLFVSAAIVATSAGATAVAPTANAHTLAKRRPPLLDLNTPKLGKLRLGQPATAYMRSLGAPDDVQWLPGGPIMSWYSKAGRTAVSFADATEKAATSIYLETPLRTGKGDRIGTPLKTFLKHWPNAEKADTWWSRSYHVGKVWFHFNTKNRLYAVELGERSVTLVHAPR
jgi:hypothetical protein